VLVGDNAVEIKTEAVSSDVTEIKYPHYAVPSTGMFGCVMSSAKCQNSEN